MSHELAQPRLRITRIINTACLGIIFHPFYLVVSHVWRRVRVPSLSQKVEFLVPASVLLIILLHGASALKVLTILFLNYRIAKNQILGRFTPLAIWTFNILVLFSNEIYVGYPFGKIASFLSFLVISSLEPVTKCRF